MRNQFRSEARRNWRQMPWDEEAAERIPAPRGEQVWALELKDAVRAMKSLSRRQREAVMLAGVGGLSSEDAASVMNCRPTALKSRVSRARHAMHSMLDGKVPLTSRRDKGEVIEKLTGELAQLSAASVFKAHQA
jgi:RNA polymerase sigma-70 factor (ECF subfamily)